MMPKNYRSMSIRLTKDQHNKLRTIAFIDGNSIAFLIRSAIDEFLEGEPIAAEIDKGQTPEQVIQSYFV